MIVYVSDDDANSLPQVKRSVCPEMVLMAVKLGTRHVKIADRSPFIARSTRMGWDGIDRMPAVKG
jgi:hypothetical protein